ncbi:MAG: hypothetical protein JKY65_09870 [Planctomycetes bacterium]|nr:hypothetical protein [Planctomycetota bacterium]
MSASLGRASPLAALALCLIGCATSSPQADEGARLPVPPSVAQVRQASARLHATIRAGLTGRWPARLTRSQDFPELPLVARTALRDLGAWAHDRVSLERALDEEVRREAELRLSLDEAAVPAWLREEGSESGSRVPSLTLQSWLSRDGRIGLRLREESGEVLAEASSEPARARASR